MPSSAPTPAPVYTWYELNIEPNLTAIVASGSAVLMIILAVVTRRLYLNSKLNKVVSILGSKSKYELDHDEIHHNPVEMSSEVANFTDHLESNLTELNLYRPGAMGEGSESEVALNEADRKSLFLAQSVADLKDNNRRLRFAANWPEPPPVQMDATQPIKWHEQMKEYEGELKIENAVLRNKLLQENEGKTIEEVLMEAEFVEKYADILKAAEASKDAHDHDSFVHRGVNASGRLDVDPNKERRQISEGRGTGMGATDFGEEFGGVKPIRVVKKKAPTTIAAPQTGISTNVFSGMYDGSTELKIGGKLPAIISSKMSAPLRKSSMGRMTLTRRESIGSLAAAEAGIDTTTPTGPDAVRSFSRGDSMLPDESRPLTGTGERGGDSRASTAEQRAVGRLSLLSPGASDGAGSSGLVRPFSRGESMTPVDSVALSTDGGDGKPKPRKRGIRMRPYTEHDSSFWEGTGATFDDPNEFNFLGAVVDEPTEVEPEPLPITPTKLPPIRKTTSTFRERLEEQKRATGVVLEPAEGKSGVRLTSANPAVKAAPADFKRISKASVDSKAPIAPTDSKGDTGYAAERKAAFNGLSPPQVKPSAAVRDAVADLKAISKRGAENKAVARPPPGSHLAAKAAAESTHADQYPILAQRLVRKAENGGSTTKHAPTSRPPQHIRVSSFVDHSIGGSAGESEKYPLEDSVDEEF